jgi:hypothetical protein
VFVDLLALPVSGKEPPQNSHAAHPDDPLGHTCVRRTLPLSVSGVTSLPAGKSVLPASGAGVHRHGLADDQTILDQFTDVLP